MKHPLIKLLTVALLCLVMAGCKDSHDGLTLSLFQNIVTFTGNGEQTANFEYQESDDSPVVRLAVAGQLIDKDITPGTRLLMTYSLPGGAEYGRDCMDITLRGLQKIYTGTVTPLPYSEAVAHNSPVGVVTFYRSGSFVNFTALMPHVEGRRYILVADRATLDRETAHLYFSTFVDKDEPTFNSTQVGSIDMGPVWNLPNIKSVVVHVNNVRNPNISEFIFEKR